MGWGRDSHSFRLFFSSTFMPDVPPQLWSDFAELMRRTTSTENALRLNDVSIAMDVTESAARVSVPTLIVHGRHDMRIPFSQGVELATRLRGSRLVPLDTRNHLLMPDEPAWGQLLRELDVFLADDESTPSPREVHGVS
jgi:pimeloyl-ACP methyl ester carboxylesterase